MTFGVEKHFADIYSQLYSSVDDKAELADIRDDLEQRIDNSSNKDIQKVTPAIIKEAINKLNTGKTDPSFTFTSDSFKAAPDILADQAQ